MQFLAAEVWSLWGRLLIIYPRLVWNTRYFINYDHNNRCVVHMFLFWRRMYVPNFHWSSATFRYAYAYIESFVEWGTYFHTCSIIMKVNFCYSPHHINGSKMFKVFTRGTRKAKNNCMYLLRCHRHDCRAAKVPLNVCVLRTLTFLKFLAISRLSTIVC